MILTFNEVCESMKANKAAVYSGRFCLTLSGVVTPINGLTFIEDQGFWVRPVTEGAEYIQVKDGDTITII